MEEAGYTDEQIEEYFHDWWITAQEDYPDINILIQGVTDSKMTMELNEKVFKLQFDPNSCLPVAIRTNSTQLGLVRFTELATEKLSRGVFLDMCESLTFVIKKF